MGAIVPRRVKTKDFKAWLKTAGQEAMIQRQKPISGKVIVSIEARRESDRADADNIIKHLQDLLVKQGLISDDCKVKTVSATWVENDPSAPSCKVTVVEAA
jgi:Holliday junction resolvase RusA-like endonuclease